MRSIACSGGWRGGLLRRTTEVMARAMRMARAGRTHECGRAAAWLVIPASFWREPSDFAFDLLMFWSKSFHSPFGRAGYFLCLHKESNQRNAPRTPRPPRFALRVREAMPGFVDCTSLYRQRTRAHRARDPDGPFRHALAAANGDPKIKSGIKSNGVRGFCS